MYDVWAAAAARVYQGYCCCLVSGGKISRDRCDIRYDFWDRKQEIFYSLRPQFYQARIEI